MAIPLRDSWLASALRGSDAEEPSLPRTPVAGRAESRTEPLSSTETGDAQLVERLRAGDTAAFTDLIATVVPALVRYARRRLQNDSEADDVVQDVLIRLWTRRATLTVSTTVRAYLFGAVRNAVLNLQKHQHIVTAYAEQAGVHPVEMNPRSAGDQVAERLTVDQLLAYLPERRREAIVLRYLGELSYAEIAAILGLTRVNAERLVARSLEKLRDIVATHERF